MNIKNLISTFIFSSILLGTFSLGMNREQRSKITRILKYSGQKLATSVASLQETLQAFGVTNLKTETQDSEKPKAQESEQPKAQDSEKPGKKKKPKKKPKPVQQLSREQLAELKLDVEKLPFIAKQKTAQQAIIDQPSPRKKTQAQESESQSALTKPNEAQEQDAKMDEEALETIVLDFHIAIMGNDHAKAKDLLIRHPILWAQEMKKPGENSPVFKAIENGFYKMVEMLLPYWKAANPSPIDKTLAMFKAASLNHYDIVQLLLDNEIFCKTPILQVAASVGDLKKVKELAAVGADINERNAAGLSSIHAAALYDQFEVVEYLMSLGAEHEGMTPLHLAATYGHLDRVKECLNGHIAQQRL